MIEEVINRLKELIELRKNKRGDIKHDTCICGTKDLDTVLQLIEQKDNKIKELKDDLYSANCTINDYIEERNKIKSQLKKDIKENEYTEFAIRGAWDFRNSGKLVEAKEILRIMEGVK